VQMQKRSRAYSSRGGNEPIGDSLDSGVCMMMMGKGSSAPQADSVVVARRDCE